MNRNTGKITIADEGRISDEEGRSRPHRHVTIIDYAIDIDIQLMSYTVTVNERMVKRGYDVPYTTNGLFTLAEEYFNPRGHYG